MKAVEIAKALGVSKATVSLALNGKPGISEKTRNRILAYAAELSRGAEERPAAGKTFGDTTVPGSADGSGMLSGNVLRTANTLSYPHAFHGARPVIRIISPAKATHLFSNPELDLLPDFFSISERTASRLGYTLELQCPDFLTDPIEQIAADCNSPSVAGVVIFGSELTSDDIYRFRGIQKPVVLYDNELPDRYSSVTIDNRGAAGMAVDYLFRRGIRDIGYLCMSRPIYNFEERRAGFLEAMEAHNLPVSPETFITLGQTIDECYQKIKTDWPKFPVHEALIMESYHLSIGILHAFRDLGVRIPEDVSLIGVDMLPSYLMGDCQLTMIKVPHENRATLAITLLDHEIRESTEFCSHIRTECKLIEGNSVSPAQQQLYSADS